jgi:hypothetical protein
MMIRENISREGTDCLKERSGLKRWRADERGQLTERQTRKRRDR